MYINFNQLKNCYLNTQIYKTQHDSLKRNLHILRISIKDMYKTFMGLFLNYFDRKFILSHLRPTLEVFALAIGRTPVMKRTVIGNHNWTLHINCMTELRNFQFSFLIYLTDHQLHSPSKLSTLYLLSPH